MNQLAVQPNLHAIIGPEFEQSRLFARRKNSGAGISNALLAATIFEQVHDGRMGRIGAGGQETPRYSLGIIFCGIGIRGF